MRLPTAILLALIVLMALACTATPAEPTPAPTPAKPTSSGAFSCNELADKLAAAQTETAARVLTLSWNESGCAQRAAGVTKVPTARPTATLSASGQWAESLFTKTPATWPTFTPDPWANARLKGRWQDILLSYRETPEGKPNYDCLSYVHYAGGSRQANYYSAEAGGSMWMSRFLGTPTPPEPWRTLEQEGDWWVVELTGPNCRGIETRLIMDDTAEVAYIGSSLDK